MRLRSLVSVMAVLAGLAAVPTLAGPESSEDLTSLVNPLAGSLGPGFVTVAAGLPFGMVTPGPITTTPEGDDPVNYVGYGYQDPEVHGFALTHFSGAGVHIGGELPMMPTTGAVTSSDPSQWASPVSHASETAQPGYYATTLSRYQTKAELTSTTRTAVERFTFPSTTQANLLLDVSRDNDGVQTGALQIADDRTVRGSVTVPGSGGVTVYFTARFDRPFTSHGTWLGSTLSPDGSDVSGRGAGGWVTFDTTTDAVVGARIAISYVDPTGADGNLEAEAPDGTSFDDVAAAAKHAWNERLHAIDVTGGAAGQRQTFYTNLYHALLMPDVFDDADGRYLGFDGVVRTVAPGHHHYTDLSLWDTYRTQTPLLTLIAPDVAHDVGISLLDDTDQNGGVIPKWVRGNRDYSIMGGDSGTPTLAALVTDGALTGTDAQRAYAAVLHQARTATGPRSDLGDYLTLGYIPYDHSDRGAAVTLEYAIDDASVAALAASYGTADEVAEFRARAESWKNLFDKNGTRFLRPRNSDGSWASPTPAGDGPLWDPMFSEGWQEGTGWQYLWLVPQDVAGLRDTLGASTMTQRLDEFCATPAESQAAPVVPLAQTQASLFGVYYVGNQYTPANETDLQAPWLYDWLGQPAKTARVVHAATQVFSSTPYGLPGNDDAGTMSAAYVLSTIGLYKAQPGVDAWELSTPMWDSVVVNGTSGPRLTITSPGAGPTKEYVVTAKLGRLPVHT
ncbi:MAG TPA: GH92 family glycosyl hydrolase, partial [Mycobacteriales bacterium]|nr:GH92 family glycosyl hydrolase [Mycobacteriales bacterium]